MARTKKYSPIEQRFIEIFNGSDFKDACDNAKENHHNVRNWLTRRGNIPSDFLTKVAKMTNYSINWFLTGEGEKFSDIAKTVNFDELLDQKIRKIVTEELNKRRGAPSFTIGKSPDEEERKSA